MDGSVSSLSSSGIHYIALAWGYRSSTKGINDEVFTVRVGDYGQVVVADGLNFVHFLSYPRLGSLADLEELEEDEGIWSGISNEAFLQLNINLDEPLAIMLGKGLSSAVVLTHGAVADHYSTAAARSETRLNFDQSFVDVPQGATEGDLIHVSFESQAAKGAKAGLGAKDGLGAKSAEVRVESRVKEQLYWRPRYGGSLAGCNAGCGDLTTSVPEPSSTLLALVAACGFAARRRR